MANNLVKKIIKGTATLFLTGSFLLPINLYSGPTVPPITQIPKQDEKIIPREKLIISGIHIPERFRNYKAGKIVKRKILSKDEIVVESLKYDTNNDGMGDTTVFSRILNYTYNGGKISIHKKAKNPFMYLLDLDDDGMYEDTETLFDVYEDGLNGNEIWRRIRKNIF